MAITQTIKCFYISVGVKLNNSAEWILHIISRLQIRLAKQGCSQQQPSVIRNNRLPLCIWQLVLLVGDRPPRWEQYKHRLALGRGGIGRDIPLQQ